MPSSRRPLASTGTIHFPEVSAAMLWEVLCDVENASSFDPDLMSIQFVRRHGQVQNLTPNGGRKDENAANSNSSRPERHCQSKQNVDQHGPLARGDVWLEERRFNQAPLIFRVTLTELQEKDGVYSYSASAETVKQPFLRPRILSTMTFTVEPWHNRQDDDEKKNEEAETEQNVNGKTKRSHHPDPYGCTMRYWAAFVPVGWYARLVAKRLFRKRFEEDFEEHAHEQFRYAYLEALRRTVRQLRNAQTAPTEDASTTTTKSTGNVTGRSTTESSTTASTPSPPDSEPDE